MGVHPTTSTGFLQEDGRLADLERLVALRALPEDYPLAERVVDNVVVYGESSTSGSSSAEGRRHLQAEFARVLLDGPGVLVVEGAFQDTEVVDGATVVFQALIDAQKATAAATGDHFALPGANDRLWGALDKLALAAPGVFADYYANDMIALVSTAWLGPAYQLTSQVNVVNPGGVAQEPHRDYHLGFMSPEQARQFPAHVHRLSPMLTLQGAVAHTDMPVESGPTMYLPYSHRLEAGYLACHRGEFIRYFQSHYVQVPLRKGDAAFFNPAVIHGAGSNRSSSIRRMANLLQVSSAFGRPMETVDRTSMCRALFPTLVQRHAAGASEQALHNVIAACGEGYPYPTNLDRDHPVGGSAPETQAELVWRAVRQRWGYEKFAEQLAAQEHRRAQQHRPAR